MTNQNTSCDSQERVAFEMAKFMLKEVQTTDTKSLSAMVADRKAYFFSLYRECLAVICEPKPPGKV